MRRYYTNGRLQTVTRPSARIAHEDLRTVRLTALPSRCRLIPAPEQHPPTSRWGRTRQGTFITGCNRSRRAASFCRPSCNGAALDGVTPPAIPSRPDARRTHPGGRTGRGRRFEFNGICAHFTACVRRPRACARQPENFLPGSPLVAQGWMTAWTVCQTPGPGMSLARAPGPVVNGPARAARNVRGTSRGGPPDAGWDGRVGRCQLQGVSGPESPKRALMVACLNRGLQRKWVCCRLLAGCKSVSKTRRLVIRAGGLPALPHALATVSTCGTLWPVCRRKRPAAIDAGLPSSCRRFRPRSSRRPAGVCGESSRPHTPACLLRCGGKSDSAARRFLRAAARQARRAQSEQRSGGSPFLFRIMPSNTESAALQPARRNIGRLRSIVAVRSCSRGRDWTGRGHSVLR